MSIFLTDVWVIPLLPLAAFIINIFVLRPIDVAARDRGHAAHDAHDATGHNDAHDLPPIATLVDESYVSALDTLDGHVDTPAAMPRALRNAAQQTTGGAELVRMAEEAEAHPEHPHGQPTFVARLNGYMGILAMFLAFCWSIGLLIYLMQNPSQQHGQEVPIYDWFTIAGLRYSINFYVDTLTAVMLVVVTSVSLLVQFYSQEYIEGEEPRGYSRFFAWLSLFTLSMLILVLASNFLLIYIGWELVGLCSYLLIGFLAKDMPKPDAGRPSPGAAALKAFVTTRVGDFGFLIGILILFTATGTFTFTQVQARVGGTNTFILTAAMMLVFCGAIGKSAQFPLHVWLPDAMEGPTPVSALIHAATMVAAGVYLVARTFFLFHSVAGPQASLAVTVVGGFTAFFAASIALVQNDIKRVLAYSTISQLGYMFVGLGVANTDGPGIFHLMTHAFFKALLFLGAGAVLHALSGQQDMRKMGGLATKIPLVAFPFLMATLSISGFPLFAGFFSKDEIIAQAYQHDGWLLWGVVVFTAFMTAFYMFRLWFMTFGGKGGAFGGLWGGDYRGEADLPAKDIHKPGIRLWLPLMILAVPSVFAGLWGWSAIGGNFNAFLTGNSSAVAFDNPFTAPLTYASIGAAVLGIALSWAMYGVRIIPADALTRNPIGKGVHALLYNKYYIDEIYLALIRFGVMGVSRIAVGIDRYVIDGILNGTGRGVISFGRGLRHAESGRLQNYGAAIFGGALLIAAAFFAVVYFMK